MLKLLRSVYGFFDKLEDKTRSWLSHSPILYAILGGVGVVLFWRGVWHTTDYLTLYFSSHAMEQGSMALAEAVWWDGPASFALGLCLLLLIGIFVSNFIGNEIIISGLKGEKKVAEKTEREVRGEASALAQVRQEIHDLLGKVDGLEEKLNKKN